MPGIEELTRGGAAMQHSIAAPVEIQRGCFASALAQSIVQIDNFDTAQHAGVGYRKVEIELVPTQCASWNTGQRSIR